MATFDAYYEATERRRLRRWAGATAISAIGLFAIANSVWAFEMPDSEALAPELVDFYTDNARRIVGGALLSLVSIALLVVSASALRGVLVDLEEDAMLGDVVFGGAMLTGVAGIGAETINMVGGMRAHDDELTEELALAVFDISYVLGSYAAALGVGLLLIAVGVASVRNRGLLPSWLGVVSVGLGLAMVTPLAAHYLGEYAVGPGFLILAALGALLLRDPPELSES